VSAGHYHHHHYHHHKCLVPGLQQTGSAWQYKSQYNKNSKLIARIKNVKKVLFHAVCDELNVFQSRCLCMISGVGWQDHVSNETVRSRCSAPVSLAPLVQFCRLGWAGFVLRHNEPIVHEVMFHEPTLIGVDVTEHRWQIWPMILATFVTLSVRTHDCHTTERSSTTQ